MATLTLQEGVNGYSGTRDTFLDFWNTTTGYGGAAQVRLRTPNVRNGLIRFDLAGVPSQALSNGVHGAALSLYTGGRSNGNSTEYSASSFWPTMLPPMPSRPRMASPRRSAAYSVGTCAGDGTGLDSTPR